MGQKGKFLSHRAGYSNLWNDLWYSYTNYHSTYFQNFLIKEFFLFLMTVGLTTTNLFVIPSKKISNLIDMDFFGTKHYLFKLKTESNLMFWGRTITRHLTGIYLTKLHIVKFFNWFVVSGAGYKWKKKKKNHKSLYNAENRLCLFYSSILLLEESNVNEYAIVN